MEVHKITEKHFFKLLEKNSFSFDEDKSELQKDIMLILRPGQYRIVKWMINRENNNDLKRNDGSPFSGGILVDIISLNKIIEILCCIKSNPAPSEFSHQNNFFENNTMDVKNIDKPSSIINTISKNIVMNYFDENVVNCYCNKKPPSTTIIICTTCGKGQHAHCVRFNLIQIQGIPYLCADCWKLSKKLIQCKATLIIVPQLIFNQWIDKIKENIIKLGLKIFVYSGVNFDGYIYPPFFNDFDIVIISSSNLSRDFNEKSTFDSKEKEINKYQSPLPHLKWWRIFFFENQFSDLAHTAKLNKIILSLQSIHRWIMPNTILEKSNNFDVHKMFVILETLDVKPYCNEINFNDFISGQIDLVFKWCSKLIYQDIKTDIIFKCYFSKFTTINHHLTLPTIESYLYTCQHNNFCNIIKFLIRRYHTDLNRPLSNVNQKWMHNLLKTLYEFQFTSSHPKNEIQEFINTDEIMTLQNIFDLRLIKTQKNCNDIIKQILVGKFDMCVYYLTILNNVDLLIECMQSFVDLTEEFWFIIDMNQINNIINDFIVLYHKHKQHKLHAIDLKLKDDIENLEEKYKNIEKEKNTKNFEIITIHSDKIDELIGEKSLNWWYEMKVLDWNLSSKDFLAEVEVELDYYFMPPELNISHGLNSIKDVYNVLNVWLTDLDIKRKEIISILKKLKEISMENLVQSVLKCHINVEQNPNKEIIKNELCLLCNMEKQLKIYVTLLFSSSITKEKLIINEIDETINNNIHHTELNVTQNEILFSKLIQYGKSNIANNDYIQAASEYLHILELQRTEYKCFNYLCTQLSISVYFHSKIFRAKLMANIEDSNKPNGIEGFDFLKSTINQKLELLNDRIRNLAYLKKLKEERNNSIELLSCPICLNTINTLALLPCGHYLCCICLLELCKRIFCFFKCPICRLFINSSFLSFATNNQEISDNVKGNHSIKIRCIIQTLQQLIAENPSIKILIFSGNDNLLDILGQGLIKNSINYRILKSTNFKQTIREFNTNNQVNALLLNFNYNSMDIDLSIATRVFLMEPNILMNDNNYAINLINRPEQTKPIFLHKFIVESTIDEIIPEIFPNNVSESELKNIQLFNLYNAFQPI